MATPQERVSQKAGSARINRRPPSFAVTLIALAIVFALAWMFFVRSGSSSTPPPVADGVRGTYSTQSTGPDGTVTLVGDFGAVASGNAGGSEHLPAGDVAGSAAPPESAYDAGTRTETAYGGAGPSVKLQRTVGEWPPVWRLSTPNPLQYQGLAAIVRTVVDDGDKSVGIKPLKEGARPVWRAAMTLEGKNIDVVVDQLTGIVTWYSDGESSFTAKVDWESPPAAATTWTVDAPAGTAAQTTTDESVTYAATPAAAGTAAGYAPLVSDLAPDGFALKATATRRAELLPAGWAGIDAGAPPAAPPGQAVLQLYTRGLSWFTLEQVGPPTLRRWQGLADQAAEAAARKLSYQETTLQFGAFKGETALTWYQESGPSLFVAGARRAVFVTGALTRQELVAFAEGLKPVAADAQP